MEQSKQPDEKFIIKDLNLYYGTFQALKDVNLRLTAGEITAFIGPSGCGKSTLLKTLNRMNDLIEGCRIEGTVLLDGEDVYNGIDVNQLRKRVGMVFQKPNPFPMTVYDNVAYGPRTHGVRSKARLDDIVEQSLRNAVIWDEVKDRLKKSPWALGGQQHRMCIARALAVEPEVLLMDEPTSALDPISTPKSKTCCGMKRKYTITYRDPQHAAGGALFGQTSFFWWRDERVRRDGAGVPAPGRAPVDYITGVRIMRNKFEPCGTAHYGAYRDGRPHRARIPALRGAAHPQLLAGDPGHCL